MLKRGAQLLALAIAATLILVAGCTDPQITKPSQFSFTSVAGAEPGQANVTSNTVTISGITAPSTATVTAGGELIVEGKAAGNRATVSNGAKLAVRVNASTEFGATVKVTVDVGGTKADFSVTTRSAILTPGDFDLGSRTDAEPNSQVASDTVTVSGAEAAVSATVSGSGSPVLVLNGNAVGPATIVQSGDELQVSVTTNDAFEDTVTATVVIGGVTGDFVVTTRAAVEPTIAFTVDSAVVSTAAPGDSLELIWEVTGDFDALTLTTNPPTTTQDVSGALSASVTVPGTVPAFQYVLTVSDSRHAFTDDDSTDEIEVPLWVCQKPDELITFADDELRTKFYAIPGAPDSGDITCQDARNVYVWELGDRDEAPGTVSSLVGLQHFINLERFDAQFNDITDLSPLSGLLHLESLNLDKNLIAELGPLAGLPSLRILELWDNGPDRDETITDGIVDISALASIPLLEELYLSYNYIDDLTPLAGLANLRVLFAISNNVTDISSLAGLVNLEVLRLSNNFITDGTALAGLDQLGWLELEYNELQDETLVPLQGFGNLWVVKLEGNYFTNMTPLIDNVGFPAGEGVAELPDRRQQPDHPMITIGYNCLADEAATIAGFEDKNHPDLEILGEGLQRDDESCDLVLAGGSAPDAHQRQLDVIRMYQERGRDR